MSDDKSKKGTSDDIRVDVNDSAEISYVAKLFNVTLDEVRLAIQKANSDLRKDIYAMLEKRP